MPEVRFNYCKKCGTPAMLPSEAYQVRAFGNRCGQIGCGGELGAYEEWEQARRESVGMPALEARVKSLEEQVAELQKALPKTHTYTCHNGQTHTFQVPPGRTLDEVMPVHPSTCKPKEKQ